MCVIHFINLCYTLDGLYFYPQYIKISCTFCYMHDTIYVVLCIIQRKWLFCH